MKPSRFYEIFEEKKGRTKALFTKDLTTKNFREWDPSRSKPAAAIIKGLDQFGLKKGDVVLYLGASTGTTVSRFSDIVGREGFIFALDIAPRVLRELVYIAEERKNIAPILADCAHPESYADKVCQADFLYQDIAQKNQADIFLKNIELFLKPRGYCLLAVKARSIDVVKNPKQVFKQVRTELEKELIIVDHRELDPYQKDHILFVCKKK